jgi:hypothetical protein
MHSLCLDQTVLDIHAIYINVYIERTRQSVEREGDARGI